MKFKTTATALAKYKQAEEEFRNLADKCVQFPATLPIAIVLAGPALKLAGYRMLFRFNFVGDVPMQLPVPAGSNLLTRQKDPRIFDLAHIIIEPDKTQPVDITASAQFTAALTMILYDMCTTTDEMRRCRAVCRHSLDTSQDEAKARPPEEHGSEKCSDCGRSAEARAVERAAKIVAQYFRFLTAFRVADRKLSRAVPDLQEYDPTHPFFVNAVAMINVFFSCLMRRFPQFALEIAGFVNNYQSISMLAQRFNISNEHYSCEMRTIKSLAQIEVDLFTMVTVCHTQANVFDLTTAKDWLDDIVRRLRGTMMQCSDNCGISMYSPMLYPQAQSMVLLMHQCRIIYFALHGTPMLDSTLCFAVPDDVDDPAHEALIYITTMLSAEMLMAQVRNKSLCRPEDRRPITPAMASKALEFMAAADDMRQKVRQCPDAVNNLVGHMATAVMPPFARGVAMQVETHYSTGNLMSAASLNSRLQVLLDMPAMPLSPTWISPMFGARLDMMLFCHRVERLIAYAETFYTEPTVTYQGKTMAAAKQIPHVRLDKTFDDKTKQNIATCSGALKIWVRNMLKETGPMPAFDANPIFANLTCAPMADMVSVGSL